MERVSDPGGELSNKLRGDQTNMDILKRILETKWLDNVVFNNLIENVWMCLKETHKSFRTTILVQRIIGFLSQTDSGQRSFHSLNPACSRTFDVTFDFLKTAVKAVSSCGGMFCCVTESSIHKKYIICEPLKRLSIPVHPPMTTYRAVVLGYADNNFFIVAADSETTEDRLVFDVFNLKREKWELSFATYEGLDSLFLYRDGYHFHGISYWLLANGKVLSVDPNNPIAGVKVLPFGARPKDILSYLEGEVCALSCARVSDVSKEFEIRFRSLSSNNDKQVIRFTTADFSWIGRGACRPLVCVRQTVVILLDGYLVTVDPQRKACALHQPSVNVFTCYLPFFEVIQL